MARVKVPAALRRFVSMHPEVEAVGQRIGAGTYDLLLIDVHGNWTRTVVPSEEAARFVCDRLGVRMHEGWEDPRMARRMNALDAWNTPGATRRAL
jgi:hypothetical protein